MTNEAPRGRPSLDWSVQPIGEMTDAALARKVGMSRERVRQVRSEMGIPLSSSKDKWSKAKCRAARAEWAYQNQSLVAGARSGKSRVATKARMAKARAAREAARDAREMAAHETVLAARYCADHGLDVSEDRAEADAADLGLATMKRPESLKEARRAAAAAYHRARG